MEFLMDRQIKHNQVSVFTRISKLYFMNNYSSLTCRIDEVVVAPKMPIVGENHFNLTSPSEENHFNPILPIELSETEKLVVPVPRIIANLGRLMGASMQQLDSAFQLPETLVKTQDVGMKNQSFTPSPLIEYSKSFRTTLLQISQQLSRALRDNSIKANRMTLQISSAPDIIDTLKRFLAQPKKSSMINNMISLKLNRLEELSQNNVLLSNQSYFDLEAVANLIEAFTETVENIQMIKLEYVNNTLNVELGPKINRKNELDNEIRSLNGSLVGLNNNVKQSENKFYDILNRFSSTAGQYRKNTATQMTCVKNLSKQRPDHTKADLQKACPDKEEQKLQQSLEALRNAKSNWIASFQALANNEDILRRKREERHFVSIDIQRLEHKKNQLEKDITLLINSTDSLTRLGSEMKELTLGWNNLVNLSSKDKSQVSIIKTALDLPNNSTSDTRITEEIFQQVKQHLDQIQENMDSLRKMTKVYVNSYDSDLSSLMAKLDQIITKSDVDINFLQEELLNTCRLIEDKLLGKIPDSVEPKQQRGL